ncbi:p21-Rho-binding domain protein [Trichostrongylus colubriformis]|uniref:P21-Rho-binding domain protein n=1 Tax=Trichostrongylus colubriformis TaxID=6319 RepID=A0AAN8G492_TRICO
MVVATISLDVEGVLFKTSIATLTSVKGSYFDRLFQNGWRDHLDKHGHLFIDRDSTIFPLILNYLRDGNIPLPRDEYYLERILREARFYKLLGLCCDIEKRMEYVGKHKSREAPKPPRVSGDHTRNSTKIEEVFPSPPHSFTDKSPARVSSTLETPLVPARRKGKGRDLESISLPRNFAHVAHVGWNGGGVIFDERLLDKHSTVPAIIDAANKIDLNPVYNMVSSENGSDTSHSLEVVLAGSMMHTKDPLYTKPQRKAAKLPPRRAYET